jgi:hypothetical protein
MLNLDTKGIVHSRDIKWLNLYHNDWIAKTPPVEDHVVVVDDDDDGILSLDSPPALEMTSHRVVDSGLSRFCSLSHCILNHIMWSKCKIG